MNLLACTPRFRPSGALAACTEHLSPERLRGLLADVMLPGHFFQGPTVRLEWVHTAGEDIPWEIYQGRLLDPAHSRSRQTFEAWNVFGIDAAGRSAAPVLSLKLDAVAGRVHVVRAIHCYAWEGYHAGDNVYLSRETKKWVRELVGTIDLNRFASLDELRDELICLLFHAVVGVSRLPLTSVEAPLPAFTLGEFAYFHRPGLDGTGPCEPMQSYRDLIASALHPQLAWLEKTKILELVLRSTPADELTSAAASFVTRWAQLGHDKQDLLALLRSLFDQVALSPYTDFVEKALGFVRLLLAEGYLDRGDLADYLGYLLRQLGRHLTAYDLVTFHHRGANYPDALLLDAVIKAYLDLAERHPGLFTPLAGEMENEQTLKRLRRRALRQGWLLRRYYEGLPVPAMPTSPGENARVLPSPHVRVPEEQILFPDKRTRKLFDGDPLSAYLGPHASAILRQSVQDLAHPEELRELGMAVFLDRSLGAFKAPGEPDQTPLLSYESFSRSIAAGRLRYLADDLGLIPDGAEREGYEHLLRTLPIKGVAAEPGDQPSRPGTVSLADAAKVAADFVFLRTTRRSLGEFLALFNFAPLAQRPELADLLADEPRLVMAQAAAAGNQAMLRLYDRDLHARLDLQIDPRLGYESRGGSEYPGAGLIVRGDSPP